MSNALDRETGVTDSPTATGTVADIPPHRRQFLRLRLSIRPYFRALSAVGLVGALLFFVGSLTPSLLPRVWYLQGFATGICTVLGYATGTTLEAVFRWMGLRPQWTTAIKVRARWTMIAVCIVVVPTFLLLGAHWQAQTRELVGVPTSSRYLYSGVFVVAAPTVVLLLAIARLVRRAARAIGRWIARFIPARMARTLGDVVMAVVLVLTINGVIYRPILFVASQSASLADGGTADNVVRPTAPQRSGSPASAVPWDSLGQQGRTFVASGPNPTQLQSFSQRTALTPIRAYAGLASADGVQAVAALVVDELRRTGAFDRAVLAVATTTGTGWVDSATADALEYLYNGDTAIAAMQYSFLPSPVAFIAERNAPRAAGRELFEQVYAAWAALPADHRPKLVIFGESLGSFGAEAAFSGPQDLAARTDGALFVGPPNFSPLRQLLVQERDPGSPEILPIFDGGKNVRFSATGTDLNPDDSSWVSPRTVYLQHSTDPIVWWSPNLLFSKPDWLNEPSGADVNPNMRWIPLVTFWQVTMDLIFASDVPVGHGHHYGAGAVNAWVAILHPPGWTATDTARLRQLMTGG